MSDTGDNGVLICGIQKSTQGAASGPASRNHIVPVRVRGMSSFRKKSLQMGKNSIYF